MQKKLPIILLVGVVVLVVIGIIVFFMRKNETPTGGGPGQLPPPTLVEVPFDYTVKSVDSQAVVFNGEEGDLTLPQNATTVKVYNGARGSTNETTISSLQVGQKVQIDLIPGRSASVYILQ